MHQLVILSIRWVAFFHPAADRAVTNIVPLSSVNQRFHKPLLVADLWLFIFGPFFPNPALHTYPLTSFLADLHLGPTYQLTTTPFTYLLTLFYRFLAKLISLDKNSLFTCLYLLIKKIFFLG
jgi:hypothetical protein